MVNVQFDGVSVKGEEDRAGEIHINGPVLGGQTMHDHQDTYRPNFRAVSKRVRFPVMHVLEVVSRARLSFRLESVRTGPIIVEASMTESCIKHPRMR